MKIKFEDWVDKTEVLKYNAGVKPHFGRGTMKGIAWCTCEKCVGNLVIMHDSTYGWFETECSRCGNSIDWSEAEKYTQSNSAVVWSIKD